jgi:hypothetical protein
MHQACFPLPLYALPHPLRLAQAQPQYLRSLPNRQLPSLNSF